MARGYNMGGMNRNQMMAQARKMQEQLIAAQQKAATTEVSASAGGGAVKVTATGGMRMHPRIGQFALMITQDTGRVNHKFIGPSGLFHQMFHYTFGRRRATDVSQADKKYFVFLIITQ